VVHGLLAAAEIIILLQVEITRLAVDVDHGTRAGLELEDGERTGQACVGAQAVGQQAIADAISQRTTSELGRPKPRSGTQ
jgi:hypothetical protein